MTARLLLCALCALAPQLDAAQLVLKRAFAVKYKNRLTIQTRFEVSHVKKSVNSIDSGGKDGDIHISGRAKTRIGLPLVVEIVNARGQKPAITVLRDTEASGGEISITGAWRIWFEHPGSEPHIQGDPVDPPTDTNPDHVFEIHPISAVGTQSIADSYKLIPGYTAYPASTSFPRYEGMKATIRPTATSITIDAKMIGYNYTEFLAEIPGTPKAFEDCVIALASLADDEVHITGLRRLVFLKDMAGIENVKKGAVLRVLAIPRLNLERLLDIAANHEGETLEIKLPYEFIVVGFEKAD